MTQADTTYTQPAQKSGSTLFLATVDFGLLVLILMLSGQIFLRLGGMQSLMWWMIYPIALLRLIIVWPAFWPVITRNWIFLAYPAMCVVSTLWSLSPGGTLRLSLQVSMTIVFALFIGWRYSVLMLVKSLAVVLSIGIFLSMLHWAVGIFPWPVYSPAGGLAGLFASKSMLGLRSLFLLPCLLAVLLMNGQDVGRVFRILSALSVVVTFLALGLSLSITSVLLLPFTVGILLVLCWNRIPPTASAAGLLVALLVVSVGPVLVVVAGIDPIETVLGAVGKSSSLTGRVDIWHVANIVRDENPFLGIGFGSFWNASEYFNERLATQEAGAVTSRSFHNFVLEILVGLGWAGLAAMAALIFTATTRLWVLFKRTRSPASACAISLIFSGVCAALLTPNLFSPYDFTMILIVAFGVSAQEDLRALRRRYASEQAPSEPL